MLDSLRFWILWQASLTVFFVLILLVLRAYRSRAFFDYWIVAWSCYSLFLFTSAVALSLRAPGARWAFLSAGFLLTTVQFWAMLVAATSLDGRVKRYKRLVALAFCLLTGAAVLAVSYHFREIPQLAFAIRGGVRSAALAGAFLFSGIAIRRWKAWEDSLAVRVLVTGCFAYAALKLLEVGVLVYIAYAKAPSPALQDLFALDALCQFTIVAGMCRLLIEQSRAFRERLQLFETIVPVCCVCGAVRDDPAGAHGRGEWITIFQFVARYSPARFSHGYCPKCFAAHCPERRREAASPSAEAPASPESTKT